MGIGGTGLEVILASVSSALAAQLIKFGWFVLKSGRLNFRIIVETGGMPSSHSASMTGMATSVGLLSGFDSVSFAISVGVAMVVMYDAAGVRRAAGRMASVLNQVVVDVYQHHEEKLPERMRELLGHTPVEVLVGGALGVLLAVMLHVGLG
ncbi:MAG: divergent PAP2 family protein [Candidatus Melainabacteria bacterium]|nr:divergent PAP2 family protein [Candidatus Melainabacteria bacterium]